MAVDGKRLGAALRSNTTLEGLNLSENELGDEGIRNLCEGFFGHNTTLRELDLSRNGITAEGAKVFAHYLPHTRSLTHLW